MEKIDLKDYVKTGEGANGSSYDSLQDSSLMIKLYNADYPTETIFSELEVARKVYDLGIPSPEPGVMVTDGERTGIRFRKVLGKRSYSRAFADEPERTEEFAREFARACRDLHAVQCPEGLFPEAKPQFLHLLEADKVFSDAEKQAIADFINSVPDAGSALHGDMHFGNVLTTLPKGAPITDPHDIMFIDLGYFSRGNPLFDLGMMQCICLVADEEFRVNDFHIDGKQTALVWKYFVDEYFQGALTLDEANVLVAPYQAVKLLLVEYNIGFMPENYVEFIRKTFSDK